jgi:hypothetical protein
MMQILFLYNWHFVIKRHTEFTWGNLLESSHLKTEGENNIKTELDKTCHEDINQFIIMYNGTMYQTSRYFYQSLFVSMANCLTNKECSYMSKYDLCHFIPDCCSSQCSSSSSIYCIQAIQLQVTTIGHRICQILDYASTMEQVDLDLLTIHLI